MLLVKSGYINLIFIQITFKFNYSVILATFHMLSSHMGMVANILDITVLDYKILLRLNIIKIHRKFEGTELRCRWVSFRRDKNFSYKKVSHGGAEKII